MISDIKIEINGKVDENELEELRSSVGWDNTIGPFSKVRHGIADAFLQDLAIHPDYQNNKIGSELMVIAIKFIQSKNIKWIQVIFQDHLLPFFQKFGFYIFKAGIIDRNTRNIKL